MGLIKRWRGKAADQGLNGTSEVAAVHDLRFFFLDWMLFVLSCCDVMLLSTFPISPCAGEPL